MMTIIPHPTFVYLPVWIFAVLSLLQEEESPSLYISPSLSPTLSPTAFVTVILKKQFLSKTKQAGMK
jgi:hypothetical protein